MRVVAGKDRLSSVRSRLGIPAPCPDCSDPARDMYCDACLSVLASVMGESVVRVKALYGRKPWRTGKT